MHGPWSLPCLASCSHHAKRSLQVFPVQASCRLERNGRVRDVRNGVVSQSKSFAGAPFAVMLCCWFVGCCCFGLDEDLTFDLCWRSLFALSSLHLFSHPSLTSSLLSLHALSSSFFVSFLFSCFSFFFFLFISLSLPVSLHLFLSWPVLNMGATLFSHYVFVMNM